MTIKPTVLKRKAPCHNCRMRRLQQQVILADGTYGLTCLTCGTVSRSGKVWKPNNRSRSVK